MNVLSTPAGNIRAKGITSTFKDAAIGNKFALNGNVWIKKTSRTAMGYWPACLPERAYIKGKEVVYIDV